MSEKVKETSFGWTFNFAASWLKAFSVLVSFAKSFNLSAASFCAYGQGLQSVETDKVRLLYFDPTETYLVPHILESYHGAIETHERLLGYDSEDKTTVLLLDFADYGNASATAVGSEVLMVGPPANLRSFQRASQARVVQAIISRAAGREDPRAARTGR